MMKVFWLLLIILTDFSNSLSQTGFYFELKSEENCNHVVHSFDLKIEHCVAKAPVVGIKDFEFVGAISYDSRSQTKSINIRLSAKALKTLNTLAQKLPNQKLLLVVKQRVVGSFDNMGLNINGNINSGEIDWLAENLKIDPSNP
jgi:hypothetical protein